MAARHTDRLPGGLADRSKPGDFDPKELKMGIEVEREHVGKNTGLAREIAMDHLKEDPRYYTKLKKVHRESVMEINQMLGLLEEIRYSLADLEEMTSIKATGKTSGFMPGVSDPNKKSDHFEKFPEKTAADMKARAQRQRMMRDTKVKSTASTPEAPMPAKKKAGLISRAVSRIKGSTNESIFMETTSIRSLLEVSRLARLQAMDKKSAADSAYDGGLGKSTRANRDASDKAKASVKASEFAAKLQKGKSHRRHTKHSGDAETMRHKQNALATVGDRLKHGPR